MPKPIKLGILSDTHRKTQLHQEAIDKLKQEGATHLLHAGDLELETHLQMLENSGLPTVAVYGNNDTTLIPLYGHYAIYREPHYFEIEGIKIKMMHLPYYMNADADIVISGHTHHFKAEKKGETLFINSGEVCAREKPLSECAMVEINADGVMQVKHYFRPLNTQEWTVREIEL